MSIFYVYLNIYKAIKTLKSIFIALWTMVRFFTKRSVAELCYHTSQLSRCMLSGGVVGMLMPSTLQSLNVHPSVWKR